MRAADGKAPAALVSLKSLREGAARPTRGDRRALDRNVIAQRYPDHADGSGRVEGNARLVRGEAVAEIARLKAEDGAPMEIAGATLAATATRAGRIDEYLLLTAPVLVGGGTRFFTTLDRWVDLKLVETRTFGEGVILTRYEVKR